MRLDELTIQEFKNLRNLRVTFDEVSPYTVLVGENGAGKSNLIEALTLIFRNLDLDTGAPFGYEMKYQCRRRYIRIKEGKKDYRELGRKRFMEVDRDGRPEYRPAFVFGYYSGPSDRLSALYEKHRE